VTITTDEQLEKLKAIGRICAMYPRRHGGGHASGHDDAGAGRDRREKLAGERRVSAPVVTYDFPGATCISVNEEIAHGIPGRPRLADGDLVNIDVSAVKDGVFADCGASFVLGTGDRRLEALCRDGKKAMWAGIGAVKAGAPLADIGDGHRQGCQEGRLYSDPQPCQPRRRRQPA
jgi:methionyl aminopeptidase